MPLSVPESSMYRLSLEMVGPRETFVRIANRILVPVVWLVKVEKTRPVVLPL